MMKISSSSSSSSSSIELAAAVGCTTHLHGWSNLARRDQMLVVNCCTSRMSEIATAQQVDIPHAEYTHTLASTGFDPRVSTQLHDH
jgi:hypothetical protein